MKKIAVFLGVSFLAFMFLTSCGGGNTNVTDQKEEKPAVKETPVSDNQDLDAQMALGERLYKEKCVACHQANAQGIEGVFPPLANSDYLQADPRRGVHQTLNGSHEEMVVNGKTYNQMMTPQVQTREEALAVVNYVLRTFNGYPDEKLLKMDDVKDIEINPIKVPSTP